MFIVILSDSSEWKQMTVALTCTAFMTAALTCTAFIFIFKSTSYNIPIKAHTLFSLVKRKKKSASSDENKSVSC